MMPILHSPAVMTPQEDEGHGNIESSDKLWAAVKTVIVADLVMSVDNVLAIAGVTAPPGKRMGHAGALISGGADTAEAKLAIMEECGFKVTRNPSEMGRLLKALL